MILKILFFHTCIFAFGNGFPIRDVAWRSRRSVNTLNPTGESISNNRNENKLRLKENGFQKINKGQATLSEKLYGTLSKPARISAFAEDETLSKEENKLVDSSRKLPCFYEDGKSGLSERTSAQEKRKLRNFSAKQQDKNEESSSFSNERSVEKIGREIEKLKKNIAASFLRPANSDKDQCDDDNYATNQDESLSGFLGWDHENERTAHDGCDRDEEMGTDFLNAQNEQEYDKEEAQADNDSGLDLDSGDLMKSCRDNINRKLPYHRISENDFYNENDRAGESSLQDLSSESEIME